MTDCMQSRVSPLFLSLLFWLREVGVEMDLIEVCWQVINSFHQLDAVLDSFDAGIIFLGALMVNLALPT